MADIEITDAWLEEFAARRRNVDEDPTWIAIRLSERDALVAALRSERDESRLAYENAMAWCEQVRADTLTIESLRAELERERTQNREARAIHTPVTEEAEVWIDGPGEDTHREQFPDCTDCEGHTIEMRVCSECGYDHDGDTALYRSWPCPTFVALDAARAALSTQEESK